MLSKKVLSAEGTSGTESPRSVFRLHRGRSRAQLFQFRARYEEREHAVAVLRTNAIRVDLDRDRDCAVEYASDAFPAMDAGIFLVFDLLLAGDTYRVSLASMDRSLLATPGSSTTKTKYLEEQRHDKT